MAGPDRWVPTDSSKGLALRLLEPPPAELLEYERARAELARPALEPEYPVCAKHDWSPALPFPGAPRPPMSECPGCKQEADHLERKAPERGYDRRELVSPEDVKRTPAMDVAWQAHLEQQQDDGLAVAGTLEELRAIEAADAQRAKDLERDHPRSRVAFERIEGGRVVQYFHPKRPAKIRGESGTSWHESNDDEITVEAGHGRR